MSILFTLLSSNFAFGVSNQMTNFKYTSCAKASCVLIQAPKAFIGASQENFTTSGATELRLTNTSGKTSAVYKGDSASYNPEIKSLILEMPNGGFLLYSLVDGKVTDFRSGAPK